MLLEKWGKNGGKLNPHGIYKLFSIFPQAHP
jgi:hypothetical protein